MRVTDTGARRSARAANSPPKPPPTITTRRAARSPALSAMSSPRSARLAGQVMPGDLPCQEPARLLGTPGAPLVGMHGGDVAEYGIHDRPHGFHGVLAGE